MVEAGLRVVLKNGALSHSFASTVAPFSRWLSVTFVVAVRLSCFMPGRAGKHGRRRVEIDF